jgi:glycosyltransferase involved in cell wall biosynthesis
MRRCYVDCTNTLYTGLNTGVQRVVRNIISRCSTVQNGEIECVPVFAAHGIFYRLENPDIDPLIATKALNKVLGGIRNIVDRLFDIAVTAGGKADASAVTGRSGLGMRYHAHTIRQSRRLIPFILKGAFLVDKRLFKLKPAKFDKGDVLFIADIFWNTVLIDAINKAPHDETIHILLIYDIFPVLYPQFVHKVNIDGFREQLPIVFKWADGIVSISRSALDEIRQYGSQTEYRLLYDYFHLGADFRDETSAVGSVRAHVKDIFDGDGTFLMVGTIEPRKNHRYVLDTFKRLWENNIDVRLCIVGRIGWKCRDILEDIYSDSRYGKRLFMINDATDGELNYCYSHAKAIIIASFAEGFGLPLVEALHFKKRVFASNIPVFREIGGDVPVYFSLNRPLDLVDKIMEFKDVTGPPGGMAYTALSWDESISDLFAKISAMAETIDRRKHNSREIQRADV